VPMQAYLEVGSKRVFAGALEWPGWCRSARDEASALDALTDYGPRYASVLKGSGVRFTPPARASTLAVVERLKGDATTDFGAPSIAPKADARSIDRRWLARQEKILRALLGGVRSRGGERRPALGEGAARRRPGA
jgi:hypothetical protein